jgi:hypothetical protein
MYAFSIWSLDFNFAFDSVLLLQQNGIPADSRLPTNKKVENNLHRTVLFSTIRKPDFLKPQQHGKQNRLATAKSSSIKANNY